jgi:tRNA (Thr-GGU) A37 N-methylase
MWEDNATTFDVKPIGRVGSPLTDLASAPRQADEGAREFRLVFEPEVLEGLRRLRPGDEVKGLAVTSGDHHLPMTGHNRQELARVFARAVQMRSTNGESDARSSNVRNMGGIAGAR